MTDTVKTFTWKGIALDALAWSVVAVLAILSVLGMMAVLGFVLGAMRWAFLLGWHVLAR